MAACGRAHPGPQRASVRSILTPGTHSHSSQPEQVTLMDETTSSTQSHLPMNLQPQQTVPVLSHRGCGARPSYAAQGSFGGTLSADPRCLPAPAARRGPQAGAISL